MKLQNKIQFSHGLLFYSRLRSLSFAAQYWALNQIAAILGLKNPVNYSDTQKLKELKTELEKLIDADIARIENDDYPATVLIPDSPIKTLRVLPKVILDTFKVGQRRSKRKSREFSKVARKYFGNLPKYYLRNFHFQTDGYLGHSSAEVYEYEVELLFSGTADAMRRLIIAPLKAAFPNARDGRDLKFLEIGAGTGRATYFMRLAFPLAKIIALDLSEPYLKLAARNLQSFGNLSFLQGDGANLSFRDQEFDAVYSVFIFHEMPKETRLEVLGESVRVLKKGGFLGFVDSIQNGELPGFERFLEDFPKNFHEPYYLDYVRTPMEELFRNFNLNEIQMGTGFLSKYGHGRKG